MVDPDEDRSSLFHDNNLDDENGEEIVVLSKAVSTKDDFVVFLKAFHRDFLYEGNEWENQTLDHFLEALSAYVNDAGLEDDAAWGAFARALRGAMIYE